MKKATLILVITLLFHYVSPFSASAEDNVDLESVINSESVILIDADTGYTIYEKQSEKQMYPASITKLVTAIVALESADMNEIATVSENARHVEGTRVYLEEGENVPLEKLLLGMLINSGNDASVAIAEHIDGSVAQFAHRMNTFVREQIGIENTIFTNPHGLFDEHHYTTASDMAEITRYALKNETFLEMIGIETLEWDGESWDTTLINHHKLFSVMPFEGMLGGKNGYVQKAGQTLVTVAEREGVRLIAVTLNASGKNRSYKDTIALLDYGFDHYDPSLVPIEVNPEEQASEMKKVEKQVEPEDVETKEAAPLWIIPVILIVIAVGVMFLRIRKKNTFQRYHN
ncbi:D-alanyl-D-alanine carboxypeptidase family protein [Bacillus suaedaesalsae]|uniref:D-alanyl-D-alanine carboxypeptidase n=1 Tax=Bacillus suaedaesalsae TaxID=2810349 RepID=A0ABS2DFH7_9BACI|nr:D-alanyl-D-alanine carboxypeptidase family protein [Bacillus suaedaesalsae]MBM6617222.1 D-alanyl-D-alanine carboxypeptidase [Bacillus suaedaesalsae]